jgi:hypothetical protein
LPDFRTPDRRVDFLEDVFAGSPRKQDLLGLLDVSGTPRAAAVRLITRLTQFGQDEPGQESLGVLLNKLLDYVGGGGEADNADLDGTVVEIEEIPDGIVPLKLAGLAVQRAQRVNIIQHPGGHYKKISMQNNFVAYADARHLQYLTSTEPGSSGSPVFNDDFVVVGIHHSGGNLLEPGTERHYLRNAGSSMIAVLDDLQTNAPQIYAQLVRQ